MQTKDERYQSAVDRALWNLERRIDRSDEYAMPSDQVAKWAARDLAQAKTALGIRCADRTHDAAVQKLLILARAREAEIVKELDAMEAAS